ncbi:MAG: metallophosphoesterase family protein [Anaerolineae bacterium]|nr:metallophosphoesterase family protein [Anaerolineae bacterium]
MSVASRLTQALSKAHTIFFDDSSKFVLFSDCHRGDNSWADDFAHNQMLFFHALRYYFEAGFTYIELGDGDDLWENPRFDVIRQAHAHIFELLRRFYLEKRLYIIFGNHNIRWQTPRNVHNDLTMYQSDFDGEKRPLFPDISIYEGLILQHTEANYRLFLVHGHQGDLFSDRWWWVGCFTTRYIWRQLQLFAAHDPTNPAYNPEKRSRVEHAISDWIQKNRQPTVCGHTHRPAMPAPGAPAYFNTGSCVHPRYITSIEIMGGQILLVRWWIAPDMEGALHITRDEISGPYMLQDYFRD